MARWALITSERGDAKTLLALGVATRLRAAGLRVGGFVQRAVHDPDGVRIGYDLVHVERGEARLIARRGKLPRPRQEGFCGHVFEPAAFARGVEWLREDAGRSDVLFVDDVSKLELTGGGHAPSVELALALPPPTVVVLCIRSENLFPAVQRFLGEAPPDAVASIHAPAAASDEEAFAARIVDAVRDAPG